MKTRKILSYFLGAALFAGLAVGCSDNEWEKGPQANGAQVYFDASLTETIEIALDQSSVTIPIKRLNTTEALTVNIASLDESGLFNIPTSATFSAGSDVANLVVTYDFATLVPDQTYPVSLTIDTPESLTPYGYSSITTGITYPAPWTSLGKAMYTEDIMTVYFGIENIEYEVEVQESDETEGLYRIKNLYSTDPGSLFNTYNFAPDGSPTFTGDYYIQIDATDPDAVTIAQQPLGFTVNIATYGPLEIVSVEPGAMKNGVIKFPVQGLGVIRDTGAGSYTNNSGLFKLILPGGVDVDPQVTATWEGVFVSTDNSTSIEIKLVSNDDTKFFRYVLLTGTATAEEIAATTAGIIDGTATDIVEVARTAAEQTLRIGVPEIGDYTVVIVPFGTLDTQEIAGSGTFAEVGGGPLTKDYTIDDAYRLDKADYFQTWDLWGVDEENEPNTDRQLLGELIFSENTANDTATLDAVNVKGLSMGFFTEDTLVWEYYDGVVFNLQPTSPFGSLTIQGNNYFITSRPAAPGVISLADRAMLIALVDDGYLAFVSGSTTYNYTGIMVNAYTDSALTNSVGYIGYFYDLMLVDPALGISAAPRATKAELETLAIKASNIDNYVELRGRERMRFLIDQMWEKKAAKTANKTLQIKQVTPDFTL